MKTRLNITVNNDIAQEAKNKGVNISEIANRALLKELNKKEEVKPKQRLYNISDLRCSWCNEAILNDHNDEYLFYQCVLHNNLFCDNCAHNRIVKEIDNKKVLISAVKYPDCPKCKNNFKREDCVWEKKKIIMEEVEEEEIKEKE